MQDVLVAAVLVARLVVAVALAVSALVHCSAAIRTCGSAPAVAVFSRAIVVGSIPISLRLLRPGFSLRICALNLRRISVLLHGVSVARVISACLVSVAAKAVCVDVGCGREQCDARQRYSQYFLHVVPLWCVGFKFKSGSS